MLLGLLLTSLAVMATFPETKTARWLRRWLVEAPAAWLNRRNSVRIAVAMTVITAAIAIGQFAPELMMMMLMGGGEAAIWIVAWPPVNFDRSNA